MSILAGKLWLLCFSTMMLAPMFYNIVKTEGRTFGIHSIAIISVFWTMFFRLMVVAASYFNFNTLIMFVLLLLWQLCILFATVAVFYLILNELKEKFMRYANTNDWRYLFPAVFEAVILIFFNCSGIIFPDADEELISQGASFSLYFVVNFYVIVGAWLCYKSYLYNLDFDIKYLARKHFLYFMVLCVALFLQQVVFKEVEVGFSLAVFLFFNYMTRSRTLISQDPLSGVNNRVTFNKYINNVFVSREHADAYIIFIDIDKFKQINDFSFAHDFS